MGGNVWEKPRVETLSGSNVSRWSLSYRKWDPRGGGRINRGLGRQHILFRNINGKVQY